MTATIHVHETLEAGRDALLREIKAWLHDVVSRDHGTSWKGIHDEGTYLTSFREYHRLSNDPEVGRLVQDRFNASEAWWSKHGKNGYHKIQEVHHGTEHFTIFLAWLKETGIGDKEALDARLRNAANHIVIKGKKRRAWYDPETNRFASTHLGTGFIGKDGLNIVEHLRLVRMAWLGLAAGGDPALRTFVRDYATSWARAVVDEPEIPVFLDVGTNPEKKTMYMKALSNFIGAAPKSLAPEARAEVHVANGSPSLFMALHDATGETMFLDAAERIVSSLSQQLWSPYANPAGSLLGAMTRRGRLHHVSGTVKELVDGMGPIQGATLSLRDGVKWKEPGFSAFRNTVGMRPDQPAISVVAPSGEPIVVPCPGTLVLGHALLGDETCMTRALALATAIFQEARSRYGDGREHGCGSKTVAAACVGNGRAWGAGHVSVALRGLMNDVDVGITLPGAL